MTEIPKRDLPLPEVALSQIIGFLLEKFAGGTLTIGAEEFNAFCARGVQSYLKSEMSTEEGKEALTLTYVTGEQAAQMRTLLEMPGAGSGGH